MALGANRPFGYFRRIMSDKTTFDGVEFDDHVMKLLLDMAVETGCSPRTLISSLVADVLIDDAVAEGRMAPSSHQLH